MSRVRRLGAVSFLNARPLTIALEGEQGEGFDLTYDVPSACAAALRDGRIDVGLIPTIDYARSATPYWIVPDIGIGCRGEVLTVRLFFRGELTRIGTVAIDTSSQTSVALLRILLRERYGLTPDFEHHVPDLDAMLNAADAALLIGDPVLPLAAMGSPPHTDSEEEARHSLDLGAEWLDLTGLPFVFAFWSGRAGALNSAEVARLIEALQRGLQLVPQIARTFQQQRAGTAAHYEHYLRHHIVFTIGAEELAGLRQFFLLARQHGIIDEIPELRFYER